VPTSEATNLLKLYDTEVRARPRARRGSTVEEFDGITLLTGPSDFVCHWRISDKDAGVAVARLADRCRGRSAHLVWDVHGHDRPARLSDQLSAAGFLMEHRSTLMVMDLLAGGPSMPPDIEVRRVADQTMLVDFVRLSAEAFGVGADWQFDVFSEHLGSSEDRLFVAYADGQAAGSARMEITDGSRFAGLFGGAVSPRFQGRGLYRAMVAARAASAGASGARYLTTGALETSRPILERLGFTPLTSIARWALARSEV
jgi:GNAT superfamily N-acetyltransferase